MGTGEGKHVMSRTTDRAPSARRDFLKLATLGTLVGVGAGAAAARPANAGPPRKAGSPQAGYRETPHVKKAYELARF